MVYTIYVLKLHFRKNMVNIVHFCKVPDIWMRVL